MMLNPFDLSGRVAFVSGGAGHLGGAMSGALAQAGAHVIINGRNHERLEKFAQSLAAQKLSVECACFDVTDFAKVRAFFAGRDRIDIIVNNAISMTSAAPDVLSPEDFERTFHSSVTAAFEIVRSAVPALRKAVKTAGEASIVNIASMYGAVAPDSRIYSEPGQASPIHYGPAKAALIQLARHLAAELGRENIRVNSLMPGPFPREAVLAEDADFARRLAERTMLRRIGLAEEIAGPLLFLASKASSFVTGASLAVDGGWTAW